MTSLVRGVHRNVELTRASIAQALDLPDDGPLAFAPVVGRDSIRSLLPEQATIQRPYIESFRAFHDPFHSIPPAGIDSGSLTTIRHEFDRLNGVLRNVVELITGEDPARRPIDRDGRFEVSAARQLSFYRASILISCGKRLVSLLAPEIPCSREWARWVRCSGTDA